MGFIFDFLGGIFGHVLWFFYDLVGNYIIAVTLFALIVNILMFPIAIKRQKTMAKTAKLNEKQKELQKKYGKDRKKYEQEMVKLYQQDGANPFGGCFSTLLVPLLLSGGIFGAVTKPLQNTLHISQDKVQEATALVASLPEAEGKFTSGYEQLQLVKMFDEIKPYLAMFSESELADLEEYSSGFGLFGLNLLNRPNKSSFNEMLWTIPLLTFIVSALSMYIMQRSSGMDKRVQGPMKFFPYMTFGIMAYFVYTIPAAVGVYWIINTLIGAIQGLIMNKYYSVAIMNAHDEAVRFAQIKEHEKGILQIKAVEETVPDSSAILSKKLGHKTENGVDDLG